MHRVVLMDYSVGKFYKGPGDWTASALNAYDFKQEALAVKTSREMGIDTLVVMVTDGFGELVKGTRAKDYPAS
jgi:hypothetical protein